MRASLAVTAALGCVLSLVAGCGESQPSSRAHRPGTEPIPSSEPRVSVPASSSTPMFAGPATDPRRRNAGGPPTGIMAEALARDERRRRELGIGPESLESLDSQGRRIAMQTMEELREQQQQLAREGRTSPEEDGPCGEAWDQRVAQGQHRGRRASLREQRADFMRTCRALPEEQQRCLSLAYLTSHAEECSAIQEREGRRMARRADVTIPH